MRAAGTMEPPMKPFWSLRALPNLAFCQASRTLWLNRRFLMGRVTSPCSIRKVPPRVGGVVVDVDVGAGDLLARLEEGALLLHGQGGEAHEGQVVYQVAHGVLFEHDGVVAGVHGDGVAAALGLADGLFGYFLGVDF